jgi:hypothetical protein
LTYAMRHILRMRSEYTRHSPATTRLNPKP